MRTTMMRMVPRGLRLVQHRSAHCSLVARLPGVSSRPILSPPNIWQTINTLVSPNHISSCPYSNSISTQRRSDGRNSATTAASANDSEPTSRDSPDEEDEEDDLGDDFLSDEEDGEEIVGMEINAGGTAWGEALLAAVQRLVSEDETLGLYSFRAFPSNKRVDIRLDKLTNKFGSPSLDEVGDFSRKLNSAAEEVLGGEAAGEIEIEVSSPGAERVIKVPEELERFAELPMYVEFDEDSPAAALVAGLTSEKKATNKSNSGIVSSILQFQAYDAERGVTQWRLADVRANRSGKGKPLNKKQRETTIELGANVIRQARLHIDI